MLNFITEHYPSTGILIAAFLFAGNLSGVLTNKRKVELLVLIKIMLISLLWPIFIISAFMFILIKIGERTKNFILFKVFNFNNEHVVIEIKGPDAESFAKQFFQSDKNNDTKEK